jgi:carboxyl-terminal processing protease
VLNPSPATKGRREDQGATPTGDRRRRIGVAALALFTLVVGLVGGALADQVLPEYVPILVPGHARSGIDQATFNQAVRIIDAHYDPGRNGPLSVTTQTRGSIRGLVQSLGDPYTSYQDPQQYKQQQDSFAGRHSGVVGVYLLFPGGYPVISGLVPGGPAQKAGIHPGDLLTAIGGQDAKGLQVQDTQTRIDGAVGTSVTLTVMRDTQTLSFVLQRSQFTSPMVVSQVLENQVLYLRVYQFGSATTQQFDAQLKANLPNAKSVVVDLRDDPGGYIAAATAMISRFVASGEAYELRDHAGNVDKQNVEGDHSAANVPLAVLVNGSSASAAEIVAGSLQARHRAQLVGTKTFGKGSVQLDFPLTDGSDIHLTIQHWFLPNGQSVDKGVGLQPDVPVSLDRPDQMYDPAVPSAGHAADAQLNRALALLAQQP